MPRIYDDDGLGGEQWEVTAAYLLHETTEDYKDLIAKVQIVGSPAFRKVIIQMLNEPEFDKLLSTSVAAEASNIQPLTLQVRDIEWRSPRNRGPTRPQHTDKHDFIRETVEKLREPGVIRKSQQPYYSQIHVAPKPHSTEWRFCIDYRAFNQATESFGRPLPR